MKLATLILLFFSSSAFAAQVQLRCLIENVLTQYVAESRGDSAGFYQEGIDQGAVVIYSQQIGSNVLSCVQGCSSPQWKTVHADHLTDVSPVLPVGPSFPKMTLVRQDPHEIVVRIDTRVAYKSFGRLKSHVTSVQQTVGASEEMRARSALRENLIPNTDGLLGSVEGTSQRIVTDNEAWLDVSCRAF